MRSAKRSASCEAIRGERPVTHEELELGRAALTRGYPRNFETAEQIGRAAAQLALYDLPDDYFSHVRADGPGSDGRGRHTAAVATHPSMLTRSWVTGHRRRSIDSLGLVTRV